MPALGGLARGLFIAGSWAAAGMAPQRGARGATGPERGDAGISSAEGPRCPSGSALAALEAGHVWGWGGQDPWLHCAPHLSPRPMCVPHSIPSRVPCGFCCTYGSHSETAGVWARRDFCMARPVPSAVPEVGGGSPQPLCQRSDALGCPHPRRHALAWGHGAGSDCLA